MESFVSGLYQADRSWADDPGPSRASKLYYSCLNRFLAAAGVLIIKGEDIDAQGGECGNALQVASSIVIERLSNCFWIKERMSLYKAANMATLFRLVDSSKCYQVIIGSLSISWTIKPTSKKFGSRAITKSVKQFPVTVYALNVSGQP